ncbi:DNA helicase RecQ [Mechercharimyces sp. CAU 1602]|uniref:DNA helicase RecQ n=1 Tax=Mechercharimyces sp. CAU 1602 TaxID=2973933 RepID=UPI0021624C8A|nr:DNA helicase RecQ [Mechercharimyces sp. CAU 1602]MCS1351537.1 DNA helicase RecQ [Mechercharimyces sp. CAU 1602]
MSTSHEAQRLLHEIYGYTAFRPGQQQVIDSIVNGHDTMAIMPTGGGKSICYQIPALLLPGVTLVVSPLISLMKDQVDALGRVGIPATYLNSTLSTEENNERVRKASQGKYQLIYVAPERLDSSIFRSLLHSLTVSFIAVDEAHCVSQWGHDFRPSYRMIAPLITQLSPRPIVAAFTATATAEVISDMKEALELRDPNTYFTSFARENLSLSVLRGVNKRNYIKRYLQTNPDDAGIIYTATRREADQLTQYLQQAGVQAGTYHAGLRDDQRKEAQERFLFDDTRIIVATNAFGMGIDKSNVRFVIHHNMPKNMESYYQEAGRAGRDGEPSECILLFESKDVQLQKYLLEQSDLTQERKAMEYQKLQAMMDYCYTQQCLTSSILNYFGETLVAPCGTCSNCTDTTEKSDITLEAQKIFSCIKRMRERFGISMIAKVLVGSKSKRIYQLQLEQLPTYGVMKDQGAKEVEDLIKFLIAERYLGLTDDQYPVVFLREQAVQTLLGNEKVYHKTTRVMSKIVSDNALFQELRQVRKQLAQDEGVPPYVIFNDASLREMSIRLPQTEEEMLLIKGVGTEKWKRYGLLFIEAIQTFLQHHPDFITTLDPIPVETQLLTPQTKENDNKEASHLLTLAQFQQGASITAIANERQLKERTVEAHLLRSAQEGFEINWDRLIPEQHEALILAAYNQLQEVKLKPIKENLPSTIEYGTIKAVLIKNGIWK